MLLIDAVYPQLCEYAEFQDLVSEQRVKKTRQINQYDSNPMNVGN
jgi:hypothetical protein